MTDAQKPNASTPPSGQDRPRRPRERLKLPEGCVDVTEKTIGTTFAIVGASAIEPKTALAIVKVEKAN
jgi:hypothetical protein